MNLDFKVFDSNGKVIFSATTIEELSKFFNDTIILSLNPKALLAYLMTQYTRYVFEKVEYYYHQINVDNASGKITIRYDQV
jgi:hypothetical protein